MDTPAAANTNHERDKYWREARELIVRGINDAASLTVDEVRLVSSVALLGLERVVTDESVDPPSPPRS